MSPHLDPNDADAVERFMRDRGWLEDETRVLSVTSAGEGNMNLVLRVRTNGTPDSLIVKQARPWVEKYPDIAAPVERIAVEAQFYGRVATDPLLAARMPDLLAWDEAACTALFEDLGPARDYAGLYGDETLAPIERDGLLAWLGHLHALPLTDTDRAGLRNLSMRELNHAHIFVIPFAADGPEVDAHCPGLGRVAQTIRGDAGLRDRLLELGDQYRRDGRALLHGDFYPGSWLATDEGPMIIDPEFAFVGAPEFDLGVMRAHLAFAGDPAPDLSAYAGSEALDTDLTDAFAGAEILRRLFGVAQLPLAAGLGKRLELVDLARSWLRA